MYFADARLDYIEFVNYDGTGRTAVVQNDHVSILLIFSTNANEMILLAEFYAKFLNRNVKYWFGPVHVAGSAKVMKPEPNEHFLLRRRY